MPSIVRLHSGIFGPRADHLVGQLTLISAVVGFGLHLGLWFVQQIGFLQLPAEAAPLFSSPLSALYTPFSILLTYEVYLLIRAIPESF